MVLFVLFSVGERCRNILDCVTPHGTLTATDVVKELETFLGGNLRKICAAIKELMKNSQETHKRVHKPLGNTKNEYPDSERKDRLFVRLKTSFWIVAESLIFSCLIFYNNRYHFNMFESKKRRMTL